VKFAQATHICQIATIEVNVTCERHLEELSTSGKHEKNEVTYANASVWKKDLKSSRLKNMPDSVPVVCKIGASTYVD
jgi:hypothetical protein